MSKGRAIRILGSVALLGLLAWRLDWRQLAHAFYGLDLRFWLLSAGVYVLAQLASSLRWQLLAEPLGFSMPWRNYLSFYFIGMFFNLLLPTSVGGDVVRALYLAAPANGVGAEHGKRSRPVGRVAAMLSVFADRASGLAVLVVLACVAGLLVPGPLPGRMIAALVALGCCVLLGLAALPVLPLLGRLPVIGPRLGQVVDASRVYVRLPKLMVHATLLSVAVQLASVVMVWLLSEGLRLGISFNYLACVVPLVTILTLLPISVSGVGLREVGMVVLLAPLGVPSAAAVTLSLLSFAASAAVSLVGLGLYLSGRYSLGSLNPAPEMEGQSDVEPVGGGPDQGRKRQSSAAA